MTLPTADSETQGYPEPGRFLDSLGMDWMWEWERPRLGTLGPQGNWSQDTLQAVFFSFLN